MEKILTRTYQKKFGGHMVTVTESWQAPIGICEECKTEFRVNRAGQQYCSQRCAARSGIRRRRASMRGESTIIRRPQGRPRKLAVQP